MLEPRDGRLDLRVYNEATALILCSKGVGERGIQPGMPGWQSAIEDGALIPFELSQDETVVVRLVLGRLTDEENDNWVGKLTWKLELPADSLMLCGGIEYALGERDDDSEYVHEIRVARGLYKVSVLTCLTGVNGIWCLAKADDAEPVGTWFRRTRPGQPMPSWLVNLCFEDEDQDPDHLKEWEDYPDEEWEKMYEDWTNNKPVDFLVQIEPLDDADLPLPALPDGAFFHAGELRKPEVCPLGLLPHDLVRPQES